MYPARKFNVAEAAYSTNLRLKMQEAEHMVQCIVPSRERSLALTKLDEALFWANAAIAAEGVMDHDEKQNEQRSYDEPRKAAGGGLL